MIQIPEKYKGLLLETIEEALYKIALNMEDLKGGPMTPQRKKLDKKQKDLEALQHKISIQ
ncbi:hypothetical protein HZR84_07200 [Hyphobacterium sp. CCMP332]|nr:hypothetical protein HZR84_07200 [Hyphobacterium sp. CCMP332]